jgi:manganese-dependent inorganic pyrophosphatase
VKEPQVGHNLRVKPVYVTGHRNPDTDSIGAAIGLAELRSLKDPDTEYIPVRLGELNPQTTWVLKRAGLSAPGLLSHVMLRAIDVMSTDFPSIKEDDPVREAGLEMARADVELIPVVDEEGVLTGVVTTRALARQYIRESRENSQLREATYIHAVAGVLDGELITGQDKRLSGRVWAHAMDLQSESGISAGDVVVIGNRPDAQRMVIERRISLLVLSNGAQPTPEIVSLAEEHGTAVIVSPLDTYVSARMITLAAPCRGLMEKDPLVAEREDLVSVVSEQIKESHHGTAVVVDGRNRPVGLVTRADLVSPDRRRVILVDHAEQAQSVLGVEQAEIVEILDHHHIGSIETKVPVLATFDPVGSTSTLVIERFQRNELEPSREAALVLLSAVLSDTVILNSVTTTERDRAVVQYLAESLGVDPMEYGREMFEATGDVSGIPASELIRRDAKDFQGSSGLPFTVAQIEVVGNSLLERTDELLAALQKEQIEKGVGVYALMVTDILEKGTNLLVAGDAHAVSRAFGVSANGSTIALPGVMSRKKQVAPKLLSAL